jgi:hypothetical protein
MTHWKSGIVNSSVEHKTLISQQVAVGFNSLWIIFYTHLTKLFPVLLPKVYSKARVCLAHSFRSKNLWINDVFPCNRHIVTSHYGTVRACFQFFIFLRLNSFMYLWNLSWTSGPGLTILSFFCGSCYWQVNAVTDHLNDLARRTCCNTSTNSNTVLNKYVNTNT